jgi:hypothetical protein
MSGQGLVPEVLVSGLQRKTSALLASAVDCSSRLGKYSIGPRTSRTPFSVSRAPDGQISKRLGRAISLSAVHNAVKCLARRSEFHKPIQRDLGRPDLPRKIIRFSFAEIGVSSHHPAS